MYHEKDIKGNRNEFIAGQAAEWLRVNINLNTINILAFHGLYCFVEYNHAYAHGYSHTQIYNDNVKYLVLIETLFKDRKIPIVAHIIDIQNNSDTINQSLIESLRNKIRI
jgi:hypothetical protein